MSNVGMRVYNEKGQCIVDNRTGIAKFLGSFQTGTSNGSITDSRLQDGVLWVNIIYTELSDLRYPNYCEFRKSGDRLIWEFPSISNGDGKMNVNSTVIYGIY